MTLRGFEEKQGTEKGNERRWWSGGKQEEEEGRLGRKARGRERERGGRSGKRARKNKKSGSPLGRVEEVGSGWP